MGEMGEVFRSMTLSTKERHSKWFKNNTEIIMNSKHGFEWAGNGTAMLFRDYLSVDFYPHTGRWKYKDKMHSGGADHFLRWYNNRLPVKNS